MTEPTREAPRRYTLAEIDEMREALRVIHKPVFIMFVAAPNSVRRPDTYIDFPDHRHDEPAIEERLRTLMAGGVDPAEVFAQRDARLAEDAARRQEAKDQAERESRNAREVCAAYGHDRRMISGGDLYCRRCGDIEHAPQPYFRPLSLHEPAPAAPPSRRDRDKDIASPLLVGSAWGVLLLILAITAAVTGFDGLERMIGAAICFAILVTIIWVIEAKWQR